MHILENKYGDNEPFKVALIENQDKQNANFKKKEKVMGLRLPLKGMKLLINKP
jgi:hypothetical protein